jgi:hypothetical protein
MWWLLACTPPDGTADGTPTSDPSGTASGDFDASCAATDNALRVACTAALVEPAETTWTVTEPDGTVVGAWSVGDSATPALTLWGLPPDADLTLTVTTPDGSEAVGALGTDPLPSGLADLSVTVTGAPTDAEGLLVTEQCGGTSWLVVLDGRGRVVWYEAVDGGVSGYRWTTDGTALWADGTSVTELAPDGTQRLHVTSTDPLHHDLTRGGDRVYALYAAEHDGYVIDGLHVYEGGALVADWWLADHVDVHGGGGSEGFWQREFPGATDWSHANSVWSDGERALVSLRWQDAVVSFDADPGSPGFGALDWILTGTDDEELPGDFAWPDGGGFDGQHHATLVDGGVTVFDNGPGAAVSRGLEVALDVDAGEAREVRAWSMGTHCEIQGGVERVGDEVLVTCAPTKTVRAFGLDDATAHFSLATSCASAGQAPPGGGWSRAMPVDLPRP